MFIILSPFFTCKFHRGLSESCLYTFEMKESGSRKMIMSAYFCFGLRKPYRCDCFLLLNVSVTLALFHTDAFSVRSAVLSFFSPKTHRCFARFRFYQRSRRSHLSHTGPLNTLALFTRNCEWLRVSNFRTAVKMSQNKCVRDISKFIFMIPVRIIC